VIREAFRLYRTPCTVFSTVLRYPFDVAKHPTINNDLLMQSEVFSRLFSMYAHPTTRPVLEKQSPSIAAFMKDVVNDIKQSRLRQNQTYETAFERGDSSTVRGTASQGRAANPAGQPGSRPRGDGRSGGSNRQATRTDAGALGGLANIPTPPGRAGGVKGFADNLFKDGL